MMVVDKNPIKQFLINIMVSQKITLTLTNNLKLLIFKYVQNKKWNVESIISHLLVQFTVDYFLILFIDVLRNSKTTKPKEHFIACTSV